MKINASKAVPPKGQRRVFAAWGRSATLTAVALAAVAGSAAGYSVLGSSPASAGTSVAIQVKRATSSSTSGAYLAARLAQKGNDVAAASHYMAIALARDPGNVELLSRSFTLAISGGDLELAQVLAARLQTAAPDHQMSALLLALEEARLGDFEASLASLQAIEPYGIAQFILPLVEAWLQRGLGNDEAAMASLEPMLAMNGFGSLANLNKGMILDAAGDQVGALEAYTEARELGSALRLVQALGSLYERLGEVEQARSLYQSYVEENRDSLMIEPALSRIETGRVAARLIDDPADGIAESLFHIATALNQEGGSELAMLMARMALHLKPDFPLVELLLADALVRGERYEEALEIYQGIPPEAPAHWSGLLGAATTLDQLDRGEEAIDLLGELSRQRTDRSGPLVHMADLLRGASRFEEAIEAYDEAVSRTPELAQSDWFFLYRRGIALERAKDWERAEDDLIRAIDLNPDYAHLLNYLGYSWIDRGENLAEGEELILRAVKLVPNDGYIVDSLGWAYYRTGRMQEAVEALENAAMLRSEDPVINDHLGDAYWMVGRRTEARYQWIRAQRTADEDDDELLLAIEEKLANGLTSPGLIDGPQTAGQPAAATP